jgi:hypothetical protein
LNSRERIKTLLNNKQPDKLPVNFGSSATGIHVSIVYKLRKYFGLDKENIPVKVVDIYQMLGELKNDLMEIIGTDFVVVNSNTNILDFSNEGWKEWQFNGTPVMVPGKFNTKRNTDGSLFQYPTGDTSLEPSMKMPRDGYFLDTITRQGKIDENTLDPKDNLQEFGIITDDNLDAIKCEVEKLYENTSLSIMGGKFAKSSFGDVGQVAGPMLKHPKGIRDLTEWLVSLISRKDYVAKVFEKQCEIAIENYKRIFNTIGNDISLIYITGTDFGSQNGLFYSKEIYRELFKPYYKKINNWIHDNTEWKTFMHSCGAVFDLIEDIIDSGFDVLNPVQISAEGMDPIKLKKEFGKYITFCGGGVDTQHTLPFKSPENVREEVKRLIDIFYDGGKYIFSPVHNIQANTPIENVVAMIEVIQEYR